ncbi:MAG: AraC family transcriptional regulator [Clostridiales bacterium]|nr:AraC family transcriptional regulator [Clostridiales bacterium]
MNNKKKVEFRYYVIPKDEIVLPLMGSTWNKEYGEGKERLHFHNYYEVGICHEGEGEMILGEQEIHFYSGCISIIPQTELHTINTFGKKASWEWMYFDIYELLEELYPDDDILRENIRHIVEKRGKLLMPDTDIQKMNFLIRGIFNEIQSKGYMYRDMIKHMLLMLVVEIVRKLQNKDMPERVPIKKTDIFPAIAYIKENYHSLIKVGTLAHCSGMSESYFRKVFEKYMNMKPLDYINFVRIQKSCALLRETNLSVSDIAEQVGYESISSFIRNFKKIVGCTPHQWKIDEEFEKNKLFKYNVTALKGWLE